MMEPTFRVRMVRRVSEIVALVADRHPHAASTPSFKTICSVSRHPRYFSKKIRLALMSTARQFK